LYETGLA